MWANRSTAAPCESGRDSGVQGWAAAPSSARPSRAVADSIRAVLSGCDVSQQDAIWRKLYEQGVPLVTLSAVDIALWDLWGRMAGKPVHILLGATSDTVIKYVEVTSLLRENRTRPGHLTPVPTLDDQGRLAVPQTPGMGIEPDWTYIYSRRVA
jgi:D-galactarolactone cycloisomerase